jgi:hypothetical protein
MAVLPVDLPSRPGSLLPVFAYPTQNVIGLARKRLQPFDGMDGLAQSAHGTGLGDDPFDVADDPRKQIARKCWS